MKATSIYTMSESGDEYLYTIPNEMDTLEVIDFLQKELNDEAPYISRIMISSTGYDHRVNISKVLDRLQDFLD